MAKTWFITGASSGLGRKMTQQLLARGDRVVATIRQETALADLQQSYPEALVTMILDVTDVDGLHHTVNDAFTRMGRIDVVVSNAGYGLFGAAEEVTDAQIDHQLATNLTGSIRLIRATLPHLRRQGGGRIVQVSSEGGQIAYPGFSLYHATKWGIEGFVEAVAQEVAPFGIDFIIAEPGPTVTNFAGGLVRPTPMDAYLQTPAGDVRRMIDDGSFVLKGDGPRTAAAIIAAADSPNPALRLALGSTAYASISKALAQRLEAIEAQRAIAFSADRDDV
ncbi:MAG: SDR family oxidoreductase [Alphaproteobacteria bacterium]|nr:SDR family oxidoreductase [Alphaproteobacteria bacterium]MBU1551654.1 SDR family oxidoreductase [Alphaproteobacteria bacterium]MBU2337389.1 SDR family oxidoreductase [Alphaproteobacteria bacterium]MBU2388132.1 SDR family oxidoreductase [Alphaproteobacteria bacterium]